jgi:hypothetical protein
METHLFAIASILFVLLVLTLFGLVMYGLHYALQKAAWEQSRKTKVFLYTLAGFLTWFAFTGVLAANGFFMQFSAMPPRLPVMIVPPLVFIVALMMSGSFTQLLKLIPPSWLLYIQSFRIVMEIILWLTFLDNIIPIQMTFQGLNYDILVGLTAPVIAYFCFTRKKWSRRVAIMWNFFGLALLLNIVVISILSAPIPFRVFMNEPANTFVAELPFVWLPAFVVPVAYWMHILSLKQLLTSSKPHYAKL